MGGSERRLMSEKRILGDTGKGRLHVFGSKSFALKEGESPIMSWSATHFVTWWWGLGGHLYLTDRRLLFGPATLSPPRTTRDWQLSEIEAIGTRRPWAISLAYLGLAKVWHVQVAGKRYYFQTFFKGNEWLGALSKATGLTVDAGDGS